MKHIGRYIICGLLGRGGMARVYKVRLPVIDKIAALKWFDPDPLLIKLLGRRKLHDLFVAEAKILAGLNHPNIVCIHDFGQAQDRPFYLMEYHADNVGTMIGESYRTEQPSRRLSTDKTLDYIRQTLRGLECMHAAGIIHRDIKPFNLLVAAGDTIKICDFGLSKLRGEPFAGPSNLNVGSPYYAAPEQEKDPDRAGPPADLFPLGVMMYRMLTGCLPDHPPEHPDYRPPSRLNPDLDPVWDDFIARASAGSPHRRYADAYAMRRDLDALQRHWQAHKEKTCRLVPQPETPSRQVPPAVLPLRTAPIKAAPKEAQGRFGLDDLWRPSVYIANHFETPLPDIVADRATHLIWQRSGSRYPLTWHQANAYVERLNAQNSGGRDSWRLPTIHELLSLLRPTPQVQDLCIAPLFDPVQRRLWSVDRRSFTAAFYVDIESGFVAWQDFSAPYHVRAVSSSLPKIGRHS
jgi:eukaryotic-like serine/threonine-protein kinase